MANSTRMAVPPHDQGIRSGAPMTDPIRWKRIKEVLQQALEQEPHKREQFVREICDGDPALCAEVESLLSAHQDAGSFIESPPFAALTESAEAAVRSAWDRQGALKPGDRVGTYEVIEFLAAGSMGEVYRARDTRLHRDVAIKRLPPAFISDSERLTRFEQEARVLATLNHPNIATIYAVEECEGASALVMEFVEGQTLASRLLAGAIPIAEALNIAGQITDALAAAHEKGIIHRDLKPANIKLT